MLINDAPFAVPELKKNSRPRLAIAIGDPAGIGPEVVLKALADPEIVENCELAIVGDRALLQQTYRQLISEVEFKTAYNGEEKKPAIAADPEKFEIIDSGAIEDIVPGRGDRRSGAASFAYLEEAIARTLAGEFQGVVTAPIAKSAWKAAGHHYPGQTELLAERAGVRRFGMLFAAKSPHSAWTLRTLLATTHIPLQQVPEALSPDLLTAKLELLLECLQGDFGIDNPRIAISGINPHSGEDGQLGSEEKDWLIPWLQQQRQQHRNLVLEGPVPPDTLWVKAGQAWYGKLLQEKQLQQQQQDNNPADAYLAMYHDQGLIPVKLMAFDRAVNVTIGLPFIRTSPDHGTAFDIAGRGIASPTSMKAALHLAAELARQRTKVLSFEF